MKPGSVAIVGAAETTKLGVIPEMSQIQLHADAALNALADAGQVATEDPTHPPRGPARAADTGPDAKEKP